MEYDKGDLVWFDPGLGYVLPGEVIEFHRAGQVITVQAMIGGKSQVFTMTNLSSVRKRQDLGDDGVEDMITLNDLNEASLLWNLKIRYDKEKIYTYSGSILVAVNPYRMFDIYGLDIVKLYEGQILGTLPPHIFAIGSAAYSRLSKDGASQVVVISGESGAGKTESTKLIMQYLAAVNKSQSNLITEQILEASPLLESFGNAKTVKNDNSSRFGKYLECYFKDGVITGAKITEYLLEKSRIVTQASDERNYHVFYELLSGLSKDKKNLYGLTTADKYFYLNQGESCSLPNKDDGEDFQALLSAMQVLGFSAEEQDTIFRILSSVLHLGNIYFHRKQLRHGQEGVEIGSETEIKWASHLLKIDVEGIRRALTTKITEFSLKTLSKKEARHERVATPLNIDQALDSRDAIAKALYSALFSWLVRRVNLIIHKGAKKSCISILDIFGFEDFKENSFEQLCINYANEKLQYYFNKHIFKLEQQEYAKEKIEWQSIEFQDNMPIIDLIARKPVGILHLLDDESNFPKASDHSFLEKCHYNHALNELYSRPRMSSMEFGVKHYAGQVWYNVEGFLDKNRDTLRNDVVELLISSNLQMLSEMFIDVRVGSENKTLTKANGRFVTMKPRTPTVAARFNDSLSSLIDSMSRSNPWFVRCVKPNNEKAPLKLDMPIVLEQLRYSGMLETIKIRQQGYPVRLRFAHFADRYRCLVPGQVPRGAPAREICRVVLDRSQVRSSSRGCYQLGTSKIFLKESLEKTLEQERYKKLSHAVITIQRHTRGLLARKRYRSYKKAAVKIQAAVRMMQAKKKYKTIRRGVVQAQAAMRGRNMRKQFGRMKEEAARRKKSEEVAKQRAARLSAQKEVQPEITTKRSVAGVNHLEIPAELAYILSKTSEWKGPYSGQGHITRVTNPLKSESAHYRLPHDVDYHAFTKFTNVYFKSHLWGMKREPIKTPFLPKQRDADYAESLAVFKLILRFMNDPSLADSKETVLGNYIANKGIQNERMRDEILCQLSNQTWRNDNMENAERGWLLMANCLSVFPPTTPLYKYLLKYVSDHGLHEYANLCQGKLLSSNKNSSGVARNFGPSELEWRANRKKSKMALSASYPDGTSGTAEVDSWTTAEEFASTLLQDKGVNDSLGWSVSLNEGDVQTEITYLDYVLDLISDKEMPPSFLGENSTIINTSKKCTSFPSRILERDESAINDLQESPLVARKTRSPPPLTRKLSREALEAHDHAGEDEAIVLSRTSALNNRYFDDKGTKSRSLDNLLDSPANMKDLGLSGSKLNERYHSMERLTDGLRGPVATSSVGPDFDNMESVSQRGGDSEIIVSGGRVVVGKGLDGAKAWNKYSIHDDRNGLNDKGDYPKAVSSRFIKASHLGRKAFPGSHSSRAYIERGEYVKSSAMSDTSETPSLASHVRRVRVPSQASDVDQFLDDLFMPVLDHQLDELSDARSLAASIKGGPKVPRQEPIKDEMGFYSDEDLDAFDLDNEVIFARSRQGSIRRQSMLNALQDVSILPSLSALEKPDQLISVMKGGGQGAAEVDTPATTSGTSMGGFYPGAPIMSGSPRSPPPFNHMATMPLYSPGGVTFPGLVSNSGMSPGQIDPNHYAAYQQNIQRAFLQSAVAQNIQIQQHLMAQNQALQQLLQQNVPHVGIPLGLSPFAGLNMSQYPTSVPMGMGAMPNFIGLQQHRDNLNVSRDAASNLKVSFQEPDQGDLWSTDKARGVPREGVLRGQVISPPPPLVPLGTQYSGMSFNQAVAASSPVPADHHREKKRSGTSDEMRMSFEMASPPIHLSSPPRGNLRSPQPYMGELYMGGEMYPGGVPPPPPMPTHLISQDAAGNYLDPYQRAKTVRIGKWRWPPPKGEDADSSFLHFKMKQSGHKKHSKQDGKDPKSNSRDSSGEIEWEEFEVSEMGRLQQEQVQNGRKDVYANAHPHGGHLSKHQSSHQATQQQQQMTHFHKEMNGGDDYPDGYLMQKQQQNQYHKAVRTERQHSSEKERIEVKESKDTKKNKEGERTRKDSWGSEEEEGDKSPGIGKLKISREMRQKLEALTSSHPSRIEKGGGNKGKDKSVKKLEQNRRFLLQQQLGDNRWDTVDSVKEVMANAKSSQNLPPPIAPGDFRGVSRRRPPSPTASISSQESSPVIPQTRSPPPPIKPHGGQGYDHSRMEYRNERRGSVSTVQTEKTEQYELEESSEFLQPVDRVPRIKDDEKEKRSLEGLKTRLLPPLQGAHLTYGKIPWSLRIRKEIFSPDESLSQDALHLVFCQVVLDVYGGNTTRLTMDQNSQLKNLMSSFGVTPNNTFSHHHKKTVKKEVVEMAKTCPLYFASIFPVTGSRKINDVEFVAVSHSGVRILRKKNGQFEILNTYSLEDIEEAKCSRPGSLHLFLTNGAGIVLYLPRAKQVSTLLTRFLSIIHAGSRDFVKAVADYVTREPTLLSFRKGDVIKVTNNEMQYGDKGWLHGTLDGRSGMFPVEYVTQIGRSEARLVSKNEGIDQGLLRQSEKRSSRENTRSPERIATSPGTGSGGERISPTTWTKGSPLPNHDDSGHSSGGEGTGPGGDEGPKPLVDDGKHSLFQFALQHFRGAKESGVADGSLAIQKAKKKKGPKDGSAWTWKDLVEFVKFSQSPLKVSLLSLEGELNTHAVETFTAIMRYMGDFPMDTQQTEVHCVYAILMNCHKYEALRDEVYCQVMKQTTNNKSSVPESCQRGWRLFSIIAAYFTCSEILKPYLLKYLETNAYDKRRAFHGTAMVCLQNIRKTFRYGGRKNVPSIEEITAITAGRNSKRQIYRLPGGTERVINTKSTSVVQDIVEELCAMINVRSQQEQEEFSLYCIVEGDSVTMPLAREEYVLDITTELLKNKQIFYLIFCRSVYYYPLRLDNALYIEVVFNQIAPDYLAGLLLVTPGEHLDQDLVYDIAKIAALMHRAADLDHLPTIKEVKFLLPKPILTSRDVKPPQWVNLVQGSWPEVSTLSSMEAKASVLEILQNWELFGSAFFAVERVAEPEESVHTILALNKKGVHFLDPVTHETIIPFTLDKIMSTRKVKGQDGELYLDMKCGNLMKPRIITLKAAQAHEISRQIRQYIMIEQRHSGANRGDNPKDVTLSR